MSGRHLSMAMSFMKLFQCVVICILFLIIAMIIWCRCIHYCYDGTICKGLVYRIKLFSWNLWINLSFEMCFHRTSYFHRYISIIGGNLQFLLTYVRYTIQSNTILAEKRREPTFLCIFRLNLKIASTMLNLSSSLASALASALSSWLSSWLWS